MSKSQILSIEPKGDIVCYDKKGNLRTDLNSNNLSKLEQIEIFGRIMIEEKNVNNDLFKHKQIESDISNNKEILLYTLKELTKVEFNNLCTDSSKDERKLLRKAYKRTNSLRKIEKLAKKYELFVPHEEYVPTFIPFYLKKTNTNPSMNVYRKAKKYLEAYAIFKSVIKNRLSPLEVESCFNIYTFDYLRQNYLK